MMGVFVQTNEDSQKARCNPVGYVIQENGCWEWIGTKNSQGYGSSCGRGGAVDRPAHRVVYERLRGPIPANHDLDHLCRNRACVNPDHLEPVTHRENLRRGRGMIGLNVRKTHCPKGHPYDAENTVLRRGKRECKECVRQRSSRYYYTHISPRRAA